MKIGKYEKVTKRSDKRLQELGNVVKRINAIANNAQWSAVMAKHNPLCVRIATVLMEHRIAAR
jgi:CRISPR/Cas system Type II protein with McrA/HNH and RuvC-like nuclease domain